MFAIVKELLNIAEKNGAVSEIKFSQNPKTGYSWDTERVNISGMFPDGREFTLTLNVLENKSEEDGNAD